MKTQNKVVASILAASALLAIPAAAAIDLATEVTTPVNAAIGDFETVAKIGISVAVIWVAIKLVKKAINKVG